MMTDPIADMLSRIRNANKAMHESAVMPTSKQKVEIARLLKQEGYITDYRIEKGADQKGKDGTPAPLGFDLLVIDLKYGRNRERVISNLKRVSRPGRRVYAPKDKLPRVLGGMGTAIVSTSQGLVTSKAAAEKGVGGEVIAYVW